MQIVVDTNVLFTFFWRQSATRNILANNNFDFIAPEFALEEINLHKDHIVKKAKISNEEFTELRTDLAIVIEFFPVKDYQKYLKKALVISPDENDVDFFALALKYDIPIWTNDLKLKQQDRIIIYNTIDVIDRFTQFF